MATSSSAAAETKYLEAAGAQLVLYPQAGHGFLFQYPERFGRHVLEFLR